jgi:hypothetical protein
MDPLGFALENYDSTGKWRAVSDGAPVDASAALPDGTHFQGMSGLRQLLTDRHEQFVETFIEKLMTYALGREIESYDLPAVRKIRLDAAAGNYRWSAIITGIVNSRPLQMSVAGSAPAGKQVAMEAGQGKQGDQKLR